MYSYKMNNGVTSFDPHTFQVFNLLPQAWLSLAFLSQGSGATFLDNKVCLVVSFLDFHLWDPSPNAIWGTMRIGFSVPTC